MVRIGRRLNPSLGVGGRDEASTYVCVRRCRMGRLSLLGGLAALLLAGCLSGELGSRCTGETECESGLRCFKPAGESTGICTVACTAGRCSKGTCLASVSGDVCAQACESSSECEGDLRCVEPLGGPAGCWVVDSKVVPVEDDLLPPTSNSERDTEGTNALCSDNVDNDGDGFTDCDDYGCSGNPDVAVCGAGVQECGVDSDCPAGFSCVEQRCSNGQGGSQ